MPIEMIADQVAPSNLYLDPNNPRFTDLLNPVPMARAREHGVQERAKSRILESKHDVAPLKESIQTLGFLPADRLVVLRLPADDGYVVIEGNRRLAAVKSLLDDADIAHMLPAAGRREYAGGDERTEEDDGACSGDMKSVQTGNETGNDTRE